MTITDKVADEEALYRRVPSQQPEFYSVVDGHLKVSASAFNDPCQKPSVDRAKLCDFNPALVKKKPTDGVVSLSALNIRAIADVVQNDAHGQPKNDEHGQPKPAHQIDVIPDPIKDHPTLPDNPAHALIVAHPAFANNQVFKKLKKSLARIASQGGWLIEPT